MDFYKFSISELQEMIACAENAIVEKRNKDKESLRAEIIKLVENRGFAIGEIFPDIPKTKAKSKTAPIYRDPDNYENTWSGRGRKPKWLLSLIEAGIRLEDLRM